MRRAFFVSRIAAVVAGLVCCLALVAGASAGERIYKYVDKDGQVTYSSTPPAPNDSVRHVQELNLAVGPNAEDVELARKRAQEDARLARELVLERRKADAEDARLRQAAAESARMEAQPYSDPTIDGPYYPAYYPGWWMGEPGRWVGEPGMNRPPFRNNPPFVRHRFKHSFGGSLGPVPLHHVKFRR
jgi:Domain of unknown function (DUF4124)